jgi:protein gp37
MSDLFQDGVPDDFIGDVVDVMLTACQHTYQVLTKRSERMRDMLNSTLCRGAKASHIWWGVSSEDRKYGLPRIAHLQQADVAVRFVSIDPLLEDLGGLDLSGIHWVIVGGESGAKARPFDLDWGRRVILEARRQKVACFVKQLGRRPVENGLPLRLASSKGGDWDEWPGDIRLREFPRVQADVAGRRRNVEVEG